MLLLLLKWVHGQAHDTFLTFDGLIIFQQLVTVLLI